MKAMSIYRKINGKYSILLGLIFLSVACTDPDDLLDREDTGDLTKEQVYSDIIFADRALNDLYRRVPNVEADRQNTMGRFSGDVFLQGGTVYGQPMINWSNAFGFISGGWNASNCIFSSESWPGNEWMNVYERNYQSIRAAWIFLENIEDVPFNDEFGYGAEQLAQKKGEAKFLLAFFHHELMKFFGGVTIVRQSLEGGEEVITAPRNTYDENVEFVVGLLDEASEVLPEQWPGSEHGRATKGAALALKARVLLHAASPLFNDPENPEDSPFRGQYNPDKWVWAAEAAAEVINMNKYQLHPDISTLFQTRNNSEMIFVRLQQLASWPSLQTFPPGLGLTFQNTGRNQGTYNILSQYKVINDGQAYDQSDPESGWDLQDPYKNLDPRFYRDWIYNTARVRGVNVEMYELGNNVSAADRAKNLTTNTCSYHIMMKFGNLEKDFEWSKDSHHNFMHLRYAEVLLNYAEAMNEAFGTESDALGVGLTARDAINEIRRRTTFPDREEYMGYTGGMPDVPAGYSKDRMRKEIRQERRVELNYEEHIFFDLRRWMEPVDSQQTAVWLVPTLHRDEEGNRYFEYRLEEFERAFTEAWRLMPLHNEQLILNPALVQNPGWE